MASVIPRSLKEPVGLAPSYFSKTRQSVASDKGSDSTRGVPPSPRVMTGVRSVTGSRSRYSSMPPRHCRAICRPSLARRSVAWDIETLHGLRSAHTDQAKHGADDLFGGHGQPQPALGPGFVLADHPALGVEMVEGGGHFFGISGQAVGGWSLGGQFDQRRQFRERPQEVELRLLIGRLEVDLPPRPEPEAPRLAHARLAGDSAAGVLRVTSRGT